MKKSPTVIQISQISKRYEIHHEKPTLVEKFITNKNEVFFALKDISINIKRGEAVGIIGSNGSGKTTLLKLITGITTPTSGSITTKGKIVSLIDLEAGFHHDLSGYENIFLNGMLLGMGKAEITRKILSIIHFADIHQFIDAPLYTYSQGMKLRLGFSIAIHANPDILILDEGVGVGDIQFQKKSQNAIIRLFRKGKTIIISTHLINIIRQYCTRVIEIKNGQVIMDVPIKKFS
ncbi:ABC transporter ATP-binding protein [Candidatus Woesebacteria bacterium]|jgi:ABC-type polysaccharide/polyol phosphate transport system ATPase subunit|nr:ABC transporter ATP-binding protein [Candidatus Woesebacteria bacterium]